MPRLGRRRAYASDESDEEPDLEHTLAVGRRRKRYEEERGRTFEEDDDYDGDENKCESGSDASSCGDEDEDDRMDSIGGWDTALSVTTRRRSRTVDIDLESNLRRSTRALEGMSEADMAAWRDAADRNLLQVSLLAENMQAVRMVLRTLVTQKVELRRRELERNARTARRETARVELGSCASAPGTIATRAKDRKRMRETLAQLSEKYFMRIACRPDAQGWTAFHYAAQSRGGSLGVLLEGNHIARLAVLSSIELQDRLYRERALMVSARDSTGCTPLHIAAAHGNASAVRSLLRWGADLRVKNLDGDLPMDVAADRVTRRALQAGLRRPTTASATEGSAHGPRPEQSEGTMLSLRTLAECGEDVNERFGLSLQASLHEAVRAGDLRVVKFLVEEGGGADVNLIDANGRTALHLAAEQAEAVHRTIADVLLRNGARIDQKSHAGLTALHAVAASGTTSPEDRRRRGRNKRLMVALLVRSGADTEIQTEKGLTPLLAAAKHGEVNVVLELILSGCRLASTDFKRWNALHFAAFYGHLELAQILAFADAEVQVLRTQRNAHGKLPLDLCRDSTARDALQTPWEFASEGRIDKLRAALRNHHHMRKWVLYNELWKRLAGNVNQQSLRQRYTILHAAILGDNLARRRGGSSTPRCRDLAHSSRSSRANIKSVDQTVRYVLELKGVSVDASDAQGRTPLMLAVMLGRDQVAEDLVRRGASLSHLDRGGNNVLHYAHAYQHAFMVDRLVLAASEKGVEESSLEHANHAGQHPLEVAGLRDRLRVPGAPALRKNRGEGCGAEVDDVEGKEADGDGDASLEHTQQTLRQVAAELQQS